MNEGTKVQLIDGVLRPVPWAGGIELRDLVAVALLGAEAARHPNIGAFMEMVVPRVYDAADRFLSERAMYAARDVKP